MGCNNHNPVQHRDGKPPWCKACGLTKDYRRPESSLPSQQEPQTLWADIYELERWNEQAREMILENQARITEIKQELSNINNKENE